MSTTRSTTTVEEISVDQIDTAGPSLDHSQIQSVNEVENSRENLVSDLAPVDGGLQAWSFLAASFVFEMLIWGQANSYGAYQNYHDHDPRSALYHRASSTSTSIIGTLALAGQHFVPLLSRGYFQSYPHLIKRTCQICIALSCICLILSSFLERYVAALIIFQGILNGMLSGCAFAPVMIYLPQWFDKRRGTAIGIIFSGAGVGGTVFPILIGKMLDTLGFGWTLRVVAVYTYIIGATSAYFLNPRLPNIRPAVNDDRSVMKKMMPQGLKSMFGSFAGISEAAIVCQTMAWCTISLQIATITASLGFSATTATAVLSAFNASATIGFLFFGRLIDITPYPRIMAASTLICALTAFLLLGFTQSLPTLLAFVMVFGLFGGGFTCFIVPISTDLAKMHNQDSSTINLGLMFLRGIAAVAGPLISSALYKQSQLTSIYGTKGIRDLVIFVGTAMAVSFGLAMVTSNLRKTHVK